MASELCCDLIYVAKHVYRSLQAMTYTVTQPWIHSWIPSTFQLLTQLKGGTDMLPQGYGLSLIAIMTFISKGHRKFLCLPLNSSIHWSITTLSSAFFPDDSSCTKHAPHQEYSGVLTSCTFNQGISKPSLLWSTSTSGQNAWRPRGLFFSSYMDPNLPGAADAPFEIPLIYILRS